MGNNNGGCSLRLAIIYWPLVPKQRGSEAAWQRQPAATQRMQREGRGEEGAGDGDGEIDGLTCTRRAARVGKHQEQTQKGKGSAAITTTTEQRHGGSGANYYSNS